MLLCLWHCRPNFSVGNGKYPYHLIKAKENLMRMRIITTSSVLTIIAMTMAISVPQATADSFPTGKCLTLITSKETAHYRLESAAGSAVTMVNQRTGSRTRLDQNGRFNYLTTNHRGQRERIYAHLKRNHEYHQSGGRNKVGTWQLDDC